MILPTLIVGGDKEQRKREAAKIASESSSLWDQTLLDTNEERGIEAIKKLYGDLFLRPAYGSVKTLTILEASGLTLEAQSALLKTLEEPPAHVKIVLTAPTAESLLSTVVSRCEKVNLKSADVHLDLIKVKDFLGPAFYDRFVVADKLDLEDWTSFWHKVLLWHLFENPKAERGDLQKLILYLKLILKIRSLGKRNASAKLIRYLLLIEPPLSLVPENL